MEILLRMALTACVLGTVAAVVGTGRVTLSLVVSGIVMWSFVPVLQLFTGVLFFRQAGLTAYFRTGRYWLLWLLFGGAFMLLTPDNGVRMIYFLPTVVVPIVLTTRALRRLASRRVVLLHQLVTLALFVGYAAWAIGGWSRVVGLLRGA